MDKTERVKVVQAAKEIGCDMEYLRRKMKTGRWDLGRVEKPSSPGGKYNYFIFRAKLDEFLGKGNERKE